MKTSDQTLSCIVGMANSLHQWADVFTLVQKRAIQEASDALEDVVDELEGEDP